MKNNKPVNKIVQTEYYFAKSAIIGLMGLIGMSEAGRRANMTRPGIRTALKNAGVTLVEISPRAFAVEESDLAAFIAGRGTYAGRGRPPGAKNKASNSEPEKPKKDA